MQYTRQPDKGGYGGPALIFAAVAASCFYVYAGPEEKPGPLAAKVAGGTGSERTREPTREPRGIEADSDPDQVRDDNPQQAPQAHPQAHPRATPLDRRLEAAYSLMSSKQSNMDQAGFVEYMARLEGEAPARIQQNHPYMPFAADWGERGRIDDAEKRFGISSSPDQMNRYWPYRESRIEQGGAKTMHLKDPYHGVVKAKSDVHPWLESDMSGTEPALMLGSEGEQGARAEGMAGTRMALSPQDFMENRMAENSRVETLHPEAPKKLPEFLRPVQTNKKRQAVPQEEENEQPSDLHSQVSEHQEEFTALEQAFKEK
jgi:hypothetical protein